MCELSWAPPERRPVPPLPAAAILYAPPPPTHTTPRSTPILLLYQLHLFIRPILSGAILNSVKSLRCKFASVSFLFLCGRSLVINFIPYSTPQQMARTSPLGFRALRLLLSAYVFIRIVHMECTCFYNFFNL